MKRASTYLNSADTRITREKTLLPAASVIFMGFEEISLEMKQDPFLLNSCVRVTANRQNQHHL